MYVGVNKPCHTLSPNVVVPASLVLAATCLAVAFWRRRLRCGSGIQQVPPQELFLQQQQQQQQGPGTREAAKQHTEGSNAKQRLPIRRRTALKAQLSAFIGTEHAEALLESLRTPPLTTTIRVNTAAATRAEAERRLLDAGVGGLAGLRPHPALSDVLEIPVRGPFAIERSLPFAIAVDQSCAESVLRGADVFAPGVLGCSPGLCEGERVAVVVANLNHRAETALGSKLSSGSVALLDETEGWLHCGNGVAVLGRADLFPPGHHRTDRPVAKGSRPTGLAVRMDERVYSAPSLHGVLPDLLLLQNLPSAVTVHMLDPQPGERILDMCAAPGGKATHCAALLGGRGSVVALDRSARRLAEVEKLASRLGVEATMECVCLDATLALERWPPGSFDRVLLDPPCSALGQRPRLILTATPEEVCACAAYQMRLVSAAVGLLKPGGVLVYSTCTVSAEENEMVIAHALEAYPQMCLVPSLTSTLAQASHAYSLGAAPTAAPSPTATPSPPSSALDATASLGGPGWPGCGLRAEQCTLVRRWDPTTAAGAGHIGFFAARLVKLKLEEGAGGG